MIPAVLQIFVAIVPVVVEWITAAVAGDAPAAREAMFKTQSMIADEVEKRKFPNG